MTKEERVIAEKFMAKLIPYVEVKDYGALLATIHVQLKQRQLENSKHTLKP